MNQRVESPAWFVPLVGVAVTLPLLYWWRIRGRSADNSLTRAILLVAGLTAAVVVTGKVTL